jgi:hypothetical protein
MSTMKVIQPAPLEGHALAEPVVGQVTRDLVMHEAGLGARVRGVVPSPPQPRGDASTKFP